MNFAARSGRAVARDLRSKMSGMQLPIVKSFRVSLCEEPPKFFFCWDPKRGCKSVFEVSQLVQAGCVASFTHSLPALARKFKYTFPTRFEVSTKIYMEVAHRS